MLFEIATDGPGFTVDEPHGSARPPVEAAAVARDCTAGEIEASLPRSGLKPAMSLTSYSISSFPPPMRAHPRCCCCMARVETKTIWCRWGASCFQGQRCWPRAAMCRSKAPCAFSGAWPRAFSTSRMSRRRVQALAGFLASATEPLRSGRPASHRPSAFPTAPTWPPCCCNCGRSRSPEPCFSVPWSCSTSPPRSGPWPASAFLWPVGTQDPIVPGDHPARLAALLRAGGAEVTLQSTRPLTAWRRKTSPSQSLARWRAPGRVRAADSQRHPRARATFPAFLVRHSAAGFLYSRSAMNMIYRRLENPACKSARCRSAPGSPSASRSATQRPPASCTRPTTPA